MDLLGARTVANVPTTSLTAAPIPAGTALGCARNPIWVAARSALGGGSAACERLARPVQPHLASAARGAKDVVQKALPCGYLGNAGYNPKQQLVPLAARDRRGHSELGAAPPAADCRARGHGGSRPGRNGGDRGASHSPAQRHGGDLHQEHEPAASGRCDRDNRGRAQAANPPCHAAAPRGVRVAASPPDALGAATRHDHTKPAAAIVGDAVACGPTDLPLANAMSRRAVLADE